MTAASSANPKRGSPELFQRDVDIVSANQNIPRAAALAQAIIQSSEDAIISKTLDGIITSWNARAEEMFGYTADEMIGQSLQRIFPVDRGHEEIQILALIRKGQRVSHFDTIRLRKDGSPFDVSVTISPIHDATGQVVGASKFIRDVSERKRSERRSAALASAVARQIIELSTQLGESEAVLLAQSHLMNSMLREFGNAERLKVEAERKRLSQELHDEIGQMLTALNLNLEMIRRNAPNPAVEAPLRTAKTIVDEIVNSLRRIIYGLRPPQLDDYGLVAALNWHIDSIRPLAGMKLEFTENLGAKRLPPLIELACFRIIQEALTNVLRHAGARRTVIRIDDRGDSIQLLVDDDGVGMNVQHYRENAHGHLGLRDINERAHALGGRVDITSTPISGCRIAVSIPLHGLPEASA